MVPRTWEDFSSGDTYSGFIAEELHDIGFESVSFDVDIMIEAKAKELAVKRYIGLHS